MVDPRIRRHLPEFYDEWRILKIEAKDKFTHTMTIKTVPKKNKWNGKNIYISKLSIIPVNGAARGGSPE